MSKRWQRKHSKAKKISESKAYYEFWLRAWINQGGKVTHNYDYDYNKIAKISRTDSITTDVYGSESYDEIGIYGAKITGKGHCHGYFFDKNGKAVHSNDSFLFVPIYKDLKLAHMFLAEKNPSYYKLYYADFKFNAIFDLKKINSDDDLVGQLHDKYKSMENEPQKFVKNYEDFLKIIIKNNLHTDSTDLQQDYINMYIRNNEKTDCEILERRITSYIMRYFMLDKVKEATASDYEEWLIDWINQGGKVTHIYDYKYSKTAYVSEIDFTTDDSYGTEDYNVIGSKGAKITADGRCHGYYYDEDGKAVVDGHNTLFVPLYDNMPTAHKLLAEKDLNTYNKLYKAMHLGTLSKAPLQKRLKSIRSEQVKK